MCVHLFRYISVSLSCVVTQASSGKYLTNLVTLCRAGWLYSHRKTNVSDSHVLQ